MTNLKLSQAELEAVLHWRGKHAQAIRERDALQLLLNERDEQNHSLEQRCQAEQAACQAADRRVEEMKAALRRASQFVVNGVDLGYIQMPDADTPDPAHDLLPMIDATLSK